MSIKVAQCWDDGTVNDIKVAELCRKYNAKATFNINPGLRSQTKRVFRWDTGDFKVIGLSRDEMKSVYRGFKVASHNWCHECAGKYPDELFVQSALDARHWIEDTFDQEAPGYAWPCGVTTPKTLELLREAGFLYARTIADTDRVSSYQDPLLLNPSCHFSNPDFWERFEKAKADGIFYFWGHSFEMHDEPERWRAFEEQLARLSADPEVEWIDVADIVRSQVPEKK